MICANFQVLELYGPQFNEYDLAGFYSSLPPFDAATVSSNLVSFSRAACLENSAGGDIGISGGAVPKTTTTTKSFPTVDTHAAMGTFSGKTHNYVRHEDEDACVIEADEFYQSVNDLFDADLSKDSVVYNSADADSDFESKTKTGKRKKHKKQQVSNFLN